MKKADNRTPEEKRRKEIFARLLKQLTVSHEWTQEKIATHLGYSPRDYSRFVSPTDKKWPHPSRLPDIAVFFGVSINDFYDPIETRIHHSKDEMRLLTSLRKSHRNHPYLPIEMITQSLLLILTALAPGDRNAWLDIGRRLGRLNKQSKKSK